MIDNSMTLLHIAYQHFHQKVLDFLDCSLHILFLLLVENHFVKTKTSHHSTFCIVQQIVSVRASKIHLNQWNIISITLQKWSLKRDKIFCFHEIAMRANPWLVLFNRDPHTVLPFVVLILGKQQTLSNMLRWIINSASRMQVQYSLFHFMALSGAFRHFQTLSNSQWCNRHR